MKTILSSLAVAAALLAAAPNAARADDCDRDHRGPAAYVPPGPTPYGYGGAVYGTPVGQHEDGWRDGDREWREHRHDRWGRRAAERDRLQAEFARLDAERDAFYARYGWNRWKVVRYEQSYRVRRAELERRWDALNAWASR